MEFQNFLQTEQKEAQSEPEELSMFMRDYLQDPRRDTHEPYFSTAEV